MIIRTVLKASAISLALLVSPQASAATFSLGVGTYKFAGDDPNLLFDRYIGEFSIGVQGNLFSAGGNINGAGLSLNGGDRFPPPPQLFTASRDSDGLFTFELSGAGTAYTGGCPDIFGNLSCQPNVFPSPVSFFIHTFGDLTLVPPSPVPLPAAAPLLASAMGVAGLISWRRKRKQRAGVV